jgi:hypothetical protein
MGLRHLWGSPPIAPPLWRQNSEKGARGHHDCLGNILDGGLLVALLMSLRIFRSHQNKQASFLFASLNLVAYGCGQRLHPYATNSNG